MFKNSQPPNHHPCATNSVKFILIFSFTDALEKVSLNKMKKKKKNVFFFILSFRLEGLK